MEIKDIFAMNGLSIGTDKMVILVLLLIWEMIWKGFGLWKAAKNNHTGWFIAMLVFNTIGILPILYINFFAPKGSESK